jgi:hypothetical protein
VSPDGSRLAFSLGETPRVEDFQILDLQSGAIVKPVTAGIRAHAGSSYSQTSSPASLPMASIAFALTDRGSPNS